MGIEHSGQSLSLADSAALAPPSPAKSHLNRRFLDSSWTHFLRERGIWITEACDKCGQLLGAVCWTRRGEPGEWCSAACRDGIKAERPTSASIELAAAVSTQQQKRIGSRRSGRPKTHATNAEKQRSYRCRLKNRLALRNTPSEQIENARLAEAKNGSHVVHPCRAAEGLETPPRIQFLSGSRPQNLPKESL